MVPDPRIDARRPRREAIVELTLTDGTLLTEWVRDVRGTADNPMTRTEVVDKARDLIAPVLGKATADRLIETVLTLETASGPRLFRVAGVYREYGNDRGEVLISRQEGFFVYSTSDGKVFAARGVFKGESLCDDWLYCARCEQPRNDFPCGCTSGDAFREEQKAPNA